MKPRDQRVAPQTGRIVGIRCKRCRAELSHYEPQNRNLREQIERDLNRERASHLRSCKGPVEMFIK